MPTDAPPPAGPGSASVFVSVVMSCFNEGRWLPYSIPSILDQGYENLELLVIDDGSSDGTMDYLRSVESSRLRATRNDVRHGLAANLNHLTSAARGQLIKIMCPDDMLPPGAIAELARVYRQNPEVGCIVSGCEFIDENGHRTGSSSPQPEPAILSPPEADAFALTHGGCVNISTIAAARASWLAVGGVRESKASDFDLIARLQARYKLALLPQPLVQIRRHSASWGQEMESAWASAESDMQVIASIARRALDAGQFTRDEIDTRMAQYTARSHFLTVLHFLGRGKPTEAITIARIIRRFVPLNRVARTWLKNLLARKSGRLANGLRNMVRS